jgi:hypothetical protein
MRVRLSQPFMAAILAAAFLAGVPAKSKAQALPTPQCAWPLQWTAFGLGNWLFPDTGNRWWYMPIDPRWRHLTLSGVYPKARFFSIAVYDGAPVATDLSDRLYDAAIAPDPGSVNPFAAEGAPAESAQNYTISVARDGASQDNTIQLKADAGWLVYRLYLPNGGEGAMGGVPLPVVSVRDENGREEELPPCPVVNRQSQLAVISPQFVPPMLEAPPAVPQVPDRIWFAPIPKPPMRLLPNPDNKYMISYFMPDYQRDRVIVVRGKMPGYPDTYRGSRATQAAQGFDAVELRYWSVCTASLVSPLPIIGCSVDAETPRDKDNFYTVVITNDVIRPDWLAAEHRWLPWGDDQMAPVTIFMRNTLPASDFIHSAQEAVAQGCGVEFNFPVPPSQEGIEQAGNCARKVMGDYYPLAAWCDKDTFLAKGWQGCFAQAEIE